MHSSPRVIKWYIIYKLISQFEMVIKWGRSSIGLHPNLQTYKNYIMKANVKGIIPS
jgi:hypothetical protein